MFLAPIPFDSPRFSIPATGFARRESAQAAACDGFRPSTLRRRTR